MVSEWLEYHNVIYIPFMLKPVSEFTYSPLGIQIHFALIMFAVFLFFYVLTFGMARVVLNL